MNLTRVAYAYVQAGGSVPLPAISRVSAEIAEYLDSHRGDLLERARSEKIAEAMFADSNARGRFELIASGSDVEFLAKAQEIAQRLHTRMDNRARHGFFVAATFQSSSESQSMVLKLDANPQKLAAIGWENSTPTLDSVDDLLDIPGDLQKGAVFPDPRANSEVCVGDKNRDTAFYYLDAIEVVQHEVPGRAVASVLAAVQDIAPDRVEAVLDAIQNGGTRMSAEELLDEVDPPLDAGARREIGGRLASLRRPVGDVDPRSHALRGTVEADGISIQGSAERIRRDVTWEPDPSGDGFVIHVRVEQEPRKHYR